MSLKKHTLSGRNISKSYKNRKVLHGVSIDVSQGEIVALLGPNGAGKTTCFYILCGLIKPSDGQVLLSGQDITALPMYRRSRLGIGYLPQESSVFRGLSVAENIMVALESRDLSPEKRSKHLDSLLAEFSIGHLKKSSVLTLSGGEQRRVEIARALASEPDFILFDEPLAGIDPIAVHDIKSLIVQLKKKNIGILLTDHNVHATLDLADRAYILNDGRIVTEGPPQKIVQHSEAKRVYLGQSFSIRSL